jgi:hypothetical protein
MGIDLRLWDHDEAVANRSYDENSVQGYIVGGLEGAEEVIAWNI